jgi:hypothetical protein
MEQAGAARPCLLECSRAPRIDLERSTSADGWVTRFFSFLDAVAPRRQSIIAVRRHLGTGKSRGESFDM